jgi:hypothetical protein
MTGKDIDLRNGRAVSAPETPFPARQRGRTSSQAAAGPVPVRIVAPSLNVTAVVNDRAPAAYAVIDGDKRDEVSIAWEDGKWTLRWPEDAGVTVSHGSFQAGDVYGGIQFGNGNVQFNSFSSRQSRAANGGAGKEQPVVHLILPSGCSLLAEVQAGSVTVPATADPKHGLIELSVQGMSAGIEAGCALGQVSLESQSGGLTATGYTGPVGVSTMSGSIELEHAMGDVSAQTMSGGVFIHCEDSITVNASSMSGSVRVTAADGARPRVSASSMSGSVRKP